MEVIESNINTSSKEYKENFRHYELLVKDLKEKIALVQKGGGEEKIKLHKSRGKMLARERIEALLDPDTPFIVFIWLILVVLFFLCKMKFFLIENILVVFFIIRL